MYKLLALLLTVYAVFSQSCINSAGATVHWWVVMKVPPKIGKIGYGYYDSTMKSGKFIYVDAKIDAAGSLHYKTIEQINTQKLEHVAWNDEKPSGQTSSTSAHAKGFIAFSLSTSHGFFISHSIPKYPAFVSGKIDPTISSSQNVYGQHIACFTLTLQQLQTIASNILITWPFVYESTVTNTGATQNLYKLSKSIFPTLTNLFNKFEIRSALGYNIKTIYKNDKVNGSIFEDGLANYLAVSPLIAQTWGRPIEKAWCGGGHQVLNVVNVNLNGITWNEQDDHSKWVVASTLYVCLGDMNRMTSQWKRGGSFFCLSDSSLVAAVKGMIVSHDSC